MYGCLLYLFVSSLNVLFLQVMYKSPVSILNNPKINQWLSLVEKEMRLNLATLLAQSVEDISHFNSENIDSSQYLQWVDRYQAQLVVLTSQIAWSSGVEAALQTIGNQSPPHDFAPLQNMLKIVEATLNVLADSVLQEQPPVRRRKLEHLVSGSICMETEPQTVHPLSGSKCLVIVLAYVCILFNNCDIHS